jgi:hypothetical protein
MRNQASAVVALIRLRGVKTMLPQMIAFRAAMTRTGELAKPQPASEAKK